MRHLGGGLRRALLLGSAAVEGIEQGCGVLYILLQLKVKDGVGIGIHLLCCKAPLGGVFADVFFIFGISLLLGGKQSGLCASVAGEHNAVSGHYHGLLNGTLVKRIGHLAGNLLRPLVLIIVVGVTGLPDRITGRRGKIVEGIVTGLGRRGLCHYPAALELASPHVVGILVTVGLRLVGIGLCQFHKAGIFLQVVLDLGGSFLLRLLLCCGSGLKLRTLGGVSGFLGGFALCYIALVYCVKTGPSFRERLDFILNTVAVIWIGCGLALLFLFSKGLIQLAYGRSKSLHRILSVVLVALIVPLGPLFRLVLHKGRLVYLASLIGVSCNGSL